VYLKRYVGYRLCVANANVPNMLGQISTTLAEAGHNIADMINKSRGDLAYTLVDTESRIDQECIDKIAATEGVLSVRVLD
jgi:D-3-phosphoglycerate dehydrogenase